MDFGFPETIDPEILPGRPEESFAYMGISVILPYLEPYLIWVMKAALPKIRDRELRNQVERFIAQEGQHYRQHIAFNNAAGVSRPAAIRELEVDIEATYARYASSRSLRFNLAYAEAFEAATTAVGLAAFETNLFDDMHATPADIWQWHLIEELEHRTVAFDVYRHMFDDYRYRVAVSAFVHGQLVRFAARVAKVLLAEEPDRVTRLGGREAQRQRMAEFTARFGRRTLPKLAHTYLPHYTPHNIAMPARLATLAERYAQRAVKTS